MLWSLSFLIKKILSIYAKRCNLIRAKPVLLWVHLNASVYNRVVAFSSVQDIEISWTGKPMIKFLSLALALFYHLLVSPSLLPVLASYCYFSGKRADWKWKNFTAKPLCLLSTLYFKQNYLRHCAGFKKKLLCLPRLPHKRRLYCSRENAEMVFWCWLDIQLELYFCTGKHRHNYYSCLPVEY